MTDKPLELPDEAAGSRHFIFCTGIENSYPVITAANGRSLRRDGMELSGHYRHWREDFRLVRELGLRYLRYGPPYYRTHLGPQKYNWSFADKTFARLRQLQIEPITDLCHFGLPDWLGNFQNPEWPVFFAEYAVAFAKRFPWVRFYTPVNEILTCAQFSGKNGWWNERLKSDAAFVVAVKHMARATLLAEQGIKEIRPDVQFVQSESSSYFHPATPAARHWADFHNERRFLPLDLCYGHDVSGMMLQYLMDNGVTREEYRWFMDVGPTMRPHCIMGSDYYGANEKKVLDAKGTLEPSGEVLGYYPISQQYFSRYHIPIFHTETNRQDAADAPRWLWKEWFNVLQLKGAGVPILGFTWYSLIDQTDWDVALREVNGTVNQNGLFDKHRKIRPVGQAYKKLIADWTQHLPSESICRNLPDAIELDHLGQSARSRRKRRGPSAKKR